MKTGFLDLARANYAKTGVRYGRDLYDERIKAIAKVEPHGEGVRLVTTKDEHPDPIKMFGILTPQALKDSQREFKQALEGMIELVGILEQVRSLESKVGKVNPSPSKPVTDSREPAKNEHKNDSQESSNNLGNPESDKEGDSSTNDP
ncbi:hypothetical protein TRVA0_001S01706 [Trichomonascus vanleenenianus]|uniref:uncharacterized protein n=1 Tax=Trichomonascus vanleenenianus TaxID=2268995 RepID=UPI003ECAC25A